MGTPVDRTLISTKNYGALEHQLCAALAAQRWFRALFIHKDWPDSTRCRSIRDLIKDQPPGLCSQLHPSFFKGTGSARCDTLLAFGIQDILQGTRAMIEEDIDNLVRRTTLRQIEVILALEEHQSMTRAAAALGMSVANVSRTASRFESNLGMRIFEGEGRRFELNAAGARVINNFKPILTQISNLRRNLRTLKKTDISSEPLVAARP